VREIAGAVLKKFARQGLLPVLKDVLIFFPVGLLSSRIETPEGVQLDLNKLSPVTIGRIRLGEAERGERELIDKIPDSMSVVEFGAGTGYLTTVLNQKADRRHVAIEPNPQIYPILVRTLELNDTTVEPLHAAYHPTNETVDFPNTTFYKTRSIGEEGNDTVTVDALSVSEVLDTYSLRRPLLHIDIEGTERLMFENEIDTIRQRCGGVFVEFHPDKLDGVDQYVEMLSGDFYVAGRCSDVILFLRE
jgi:FkbM family methyltransferase